MKDVATSCPLQLDEVVNEYFIESRNKLVELAAFFDRVDRAGGRPNSVDDFRVAALKRAAAVLVEPGPQRVKRIMMLLSDPTQEPLDHLDRKGAVGAYAGVGEIL